jgi:hypothetical protein
MGAVDGDRRAGGGDACVTPAWTFLSRGCMPRSCARSVGRPQAVQRGLRPSRNAVTPSLKASLL